MRQRHEFHVDSVRYLDEHGHPLDDLPSQASDTERVLAAYRNMVLTRTFDAKAIALQRTGKCGTYPSALGHEVIGTAIGQALAASDVFVPYYRDQATHLLRGVTLQEMLLYWGGDERGSAWQACPQDLPVAVPIATQCCHAVGVASAFRIRGEARAVLCCVGDGGTSKGDFLESLNLAGAWHLPVVFVAINNQWAISTPRRLQTGAETIAQKAIGAGLPGHVVDGNDYFASVDVLDAALARAHAGKGATLIEAVTYRLGDHTTADDATRYRDAEELRRAWDRDGVKRLRLWLHDQGLWNADLEQQWQAECKERVEQAVNAYLATEPEPATAMLDSLFETLPAALAGQRERLASRSGGGES
ncbi:pyruvate dehydrogenase (acetyl-transferring) E1 component subunit alpha [Marinobacter lutaoensis]|jgi:pyruvate dehydrogenase E1 component alpha subunit|uniref:Pyruvate dehydrogenase E1 component subunit alpha n=1 Tax=Marinobacter lutaoensis TaxID=135739 RepID=A0A1V2DR49_9GAMM|nr:pyruvate dehydrogenase (acetyl-transferring) E1 component subunit alpha [Marinobacter lutaoensis]MBI42952.1 pyruvate dehydrogenase (acetyl-transferring) E1 component subunit alpha [Oceanospirillales bacterium]ONF42896.1 pyruvate dehydrogenase (acetyl-transferring) E1 component subunit alpha [Marinobacter lutaoensis]